MGITEFGEKLKEKAYGLASRLEHRSVSQHVGNAARAVAGAAKGLHEKVQKNGGYAATAEKAMDAVAERMTHMYDSFEEGFFSDGRFDGDKAKKTLVNRAEAVGRYGLEAVEYLEGKVMAGASVVAEDYRSMVPSKEELCNKYAGIGCQRQNVLLFRPDYEACLKFATSAEKSLAEEKQRNKILDDIKSNALRNKTQLKAFYESDPNNTTYSSRLKAVKQYL